MLFVILGSNVWLRIGMNNEQSVLRACHDLSRLGVFLFPENHSRDDDVSSLDSHGTRTP